MKDQVEVVRNIKYEQCEPSERIFGFTLRLRPFPGGEAIETCLDFLLGREEKVVESRTISFEECLPERVFYKLLPGALEKVSDQLQGSIHDVGEITECALDIMEDLLAEQCMLFFRGGADDALDGAFESVYCELRFAGAPIGSVTLEGPSFTELFRSTEE